MLEFELTFDGGPASEGLLEFYDAAKALAGFQRSLALTTHLVLHGEIIIQAPAASGFQIFVPPFIEGSWKAKAKIAFGGALAIASVGKDSPVGHVVTSVYDLVLSNTMGFHVDYDKTLQTLYYEKNPDKKITPEKVDSLCEKVEASIADMHRPIVKSQSANWAQVSRCDFTKLDIGPVLSPLTYEYVKKTERQKDDIFVVGFVSSYNINTYTGRIYSMDEGRPIPFELDETCRDRTSIGILTSSQHENGQERFSAKAAVHLLCNKLVSSNGKVKRYVVLAVSEAL